MRRSTFLASLALGIALAAPVAFAQQFSSIEERMSSTDFKAAGLDKLTPEQLARLNAFIRGEVNKGAMEGHAVAAQEAQQEEASRFGFKDYHGDTDEEESTIPGVFTGWEEGSTFTFANGQIWRVVEADSPLEGIKVSNPVVHVTKGAFGAWQMRIEGYNKMAKIERQK